MCRYFAAAAIRYADGDTLLFAIFDYARPPLLFAMLRHAADMPLRHYAMPPLRCYASR